MLTAADLPEYLRNPSSVEPFTTTEFEDRKRSHQLKVRVLPNSSILTVSCNCLTAVVIEARRFWGPGEALAVWRAFHQCTCGHQQDCHDIGAGICDDCYCQAFRRADQKRERN